MKVDHKN